MMAMRSRGCGGGGVDGSEVEEGGGWERGRGGLLRKSARKERAEMPLATEGKQLGVGPGFFVPGRGGLPASFPW